MKLISKRLRDLEARPQRQNRITSFRVVPDEEWEQHRQAMLDAGHVLLRDEAGFLLWRGRHDGRFENAP